MPVILKKANSKHIPIKSATYKCIYCNIEQKFSIPTLSAHLDMAHNDVSKEDKSEVLKDLEFLLRQLTKQSLRKIKQQKKAEIRQKREENEKVQLEFLRSESLKILADKPIKTHIIKLIENAKNINKLKKILTYRIDLKYKADFDKANLDYHSSLSKPNKTTKKRNTRKEEKNYHDETKDSIIPIYTPMGNKR